MNLTSAPSKIVLPFANGGGKSTIPVASQIGVVDGAASWTDGFPPLTRTPKAAGGVPPLGLDMNGVLNAMSDIIRWANAGAGFTYDAAFASNANISGYPKGARIARTDGEGYWINTVDGNTTDPEAGGAGWYPDFTAGATAVTMTNSNVTLTPLQYGKQIIIISGTLTANVNLIFPALAARWVVVNNTTGNYTITCKTASGTGVAVSGVQQIVGDGANVLSNGGVGYNQTWQNVLGSRVAGTTYYNTTGRPIMVSVTAQTTSTSNNTQMIVDGYAISEFGISATNNPFTMVALVRPGGSYSVAVSLSSITRWFEQR